MEFGAVCKNCPGPKKCKDKPTSTEPITIECPCCGGPGCSSCGETGTIDICCCPREYITNEALEMIACSDLFYKGLPPIAGGSMDQAASFLAAARFVEGEKSYWKAKTRCQNIQSM